ncbi:MAG: ComF family protein [Clostridiales bacterium]|nr:ComF family protein [Clostridiales bacterium]
MNAARLLRDLLFPPRARCPGCGDLRGTDDGWLCRDCAAQYAPEYACERDEWRPGVGVTATYSALRYDAVARGLIHSFKFRCERRLAGRMADEMAALYRALCPSPPDCLAPVPLSRARMRERGFNQAALLAAHLSDRIGVPVNDCLARTRDTPRQSRLTGGARRENLAGAFGCRGEVAGLRVMLVDDVITSGETVRHCAIALRAAGAADVAAISLARARLPGSDAAAKSGEGAVKK